MLLSTSAPAPGKLSPHLDSQDWEEQDPLSVWRRVDCNAHKFELFRAFNVCHSPESLKGVKIEPIR